MPTKRTLIQKIELFANSTTVSFNNIPQTFTDLHVECSVRTSRANVSSDLYVQFNGNTGNVYNSWRIYGTGSSTGNDQFSGAATSSLAGSVPGNNATANIFSSSGMTIGNYTGSLPKAYNITSVGEHAGASGPQISRVTGWTTNTSAISQITFGDYNSSLLLAGSTFYLYGITHVPIINGGEVSIRDGFKYHTFRSTSTLQVVEPGDAECLVVAGGGGGGREGGGGGGAGGLRAFSTRLSKGLTSVVVGGGGIAGTVNKGGSGSNSALGSLTATGGGGGASGIDGYGNGIAGGSGGGGSGTNPNSNTQGGSGVSGQGFSGGGTSSATSGGAGGGGATAVGGNGGSSNAGAGGAGFVSPFNGFAYAGGGGGGQYWGSFPGGAGGIGGGGAGGNVNGGPGTSGVANTGGGGGGGGNQQGIGGAGGSGIVVIRYPYDGN